MNLLLMRHAKSSWDCGDLSDHDRPLNHRGRNTAPKMAEVLVENDLVPRLILVSSSRRTQETVELMMPTLGPVDVRVLPDLYHAAPMKIWSFVEDYARKESGDLMLVAHNPGLETVVSNIVGGIVPFPTGAIAHIERGPGNHTDVVAMWRPRELPAE
jgi:phosphohistidine phosphatase